MISCDQIAHRLAAGEPLNEDQQAHADVCPNCAAALDATATLRAVGKARASVEPSPGFSSRMANRAAARIGQRRRNRIAGLGLATAGAVAAAVMALSLRPSSGGDEVEVNAPAAVYEPASFDDAPAPDPNEPASERDMVWLTDADRALDYRANWDYIEEPISNYALLLGDAADLEETDR
jgi:hypothetical protein